METSNYTWIDAPVIDVIEYFAGTAGYFLNAAVVLGSLIAVLAILWNSIQLIFGTLEVQKFIIGIISKFAFFILILNLYPVMTAGLRHFAIGLGTEASGKPVTKLTAELTAFLKQMEEIVEQEDAELNAELAAAIAAQSRIREEGTTWKDWGSSIGFALLGIYRPLDYDITQADARVTQAQKLIEERLKHPSDNMKTVMAIKTVLKPVDETGEPMEGNLGSAYRLDLSLKTKDSQDTGYLSPNSLLRVALLSAQIMWEKEWSSVVTEWEENDDKGFFTSMTKSLSFSKFPVARLFDMVLVFCCQIAIVLTMIFSLVQYVMCILEFTITAAFAVVLIPCLLFDGLKDIARSS